MPLLLLLIAIGIGAILIEVCCIAFCKRRWEKSTGHSSGREQPR